MEQDDNPYKVLGVSQQASAEDIKKAYRKLALQHHPDRQRTEESRQRAHTAFAKIGNAYEILSDPTKRAEYDRQQQQQQRRGERRGGGQSGARPSSSSRRRQHYNGDDSSSSEYDEADFAFANQPFPNHSQHPFEFHDPFEIFNQVFGAEFGSNTNNVRRSGGFMDPFADPFFSRPMFGGGSLFGGSLFGNNNSGMAMMNNDPFFSNPFGQRGGSSLFGGGMNTQDPLASMLSQQQQQPGGFTNMSSSIMMMGGGGGGTSTSTSTTTRIINGRRETVTETVIRNADGTVERHVHSSNNEGSQDYQRRRQLEGRGRPLQEVIAIEDDDSSDEEDSRRRRKKQRQRTSSSRNGEGKKSRSRR